MQRKNWVIPGFLVLAMLLLLSFPGTALADGSSDIAPAVSGEEISTPAETVASSITPDDPQKDNALTGPASDSSETDTGVSLPTASDKPVSTDPVKTNEITSGDPVKTEPVDSPADTGKAEDIPAAEPDNAAPADTGSVEDKPAVEPKQPDTAEPEKDDEEHSPGKESPNSVTGTPASGIQTAETGTLSPAPVIIIPKDVPGEQKTNNPVIVVEPQTGQYAPGYVVQPGDTLEKISEKTGVSVEGLKKANGLNVADDVAALPMTSSVSTDVPSSGGKEEKDNGLYITYKVRKGESLWLIGRDLGIPYEEIMTANNLTDHLIYPEQELIIPGIKLEGGKFKYRIKEGDTFYFIAKALGLSYEDIMSLNGFNDIWIYPDQELVIPDKKSVTLYRVKEGETLTDVAKKFSIVESEIFGHQISDGKLVEGQVLLIPQDAAVSKTMQVSSTADFENASDLDLLARAIYAEARGEVYEGKVAVGAVIMNRLKSPAFPKTIRDIIFQSRAFTAVDDGQINLTPDTEAYQAAREAMEGADPSMGALYYWNPNVATSKWIWTRPIIRQIGNHVFAR